MNDRVVGYVSRLALESFNRKFRKNVSIKRVVVLGKRVSDAFELVLSDDSSFIVKVSGKSFPDFVKTWSFMREFENNSVVSIGSVDVSGERFNYIVMRKVEGVTLASVLSVVPAILSLGDFERVLSDALIKAKSFSKRSIDYFGSVFSTGKRFSSELEFMEWLVTDSARSLSKGVFNKYSPVLLGLLNEYSRLFSGVKPRLVYVDTNFSNIIVSASGMSFSIISVLNLLSL